MMPSSRGGMIAILVAGVLLGACQAPTDPGAGEALGAAKLRGTLLGHTLARSGRPFWGRWDYAGTHHADGTMTGRVKAPDGEQTAESVWVISADGLYCRTWGNAWGAGRQGCFRVSRRDDALVFDHVSGSRGDADRYVYRLHSRGPYWSRSGAPRSRWRLFRNPGSRAAGARPKTSPANWAGAIPLARAFGAIVLRSSFADGPVSIDPARQGVDNGAPDFDRRRSGRRTGG